MTAGFADIASAAKSFGLAASALTPEIGEAEGARALVLLASTGAATWQAFRAAPEASDERPDPLDRWSRRVASELAGRFGGRAILPSDGPPHPPFLDWAMRAEPVGPSRLGMLLHAERGVWASWRAALAFPFVLEAPEPPTAAPRPCDSCEAPCIDACPVSAFSNDGYDVDACAAHLESLEGGNCRNRGCLARHACPVGRAFAHQPAQAAFHMAAFRRARRAST